MCFKGWNNVWNRRFTWLQDTEKQVEICWPVSTSVVRAKHNFNIAASSPGGERVGLGPNDVKSFIKIIFFNNYKTRKNVWCLHFISARHWRKQLRYGKFDISKSSLTYLLNTFLSFIFFKLNPVNVTLKPTTINTLIPDDVYQLTYLLVV